MNLKHKFSAAIIVIILLICNVNIYFAESSDELIIPILMYHNIVEDYPPETVGANITPEMFEKHMKTILDYGFNPVKLTDYYAYVTGNASLPDNPIIITFDDGYLSNYEIAFPILKKYNIPASIFIVTSTVGHTPEDGTVSYPHFSWDQALEMQESGLIEINSHTHSHRNLSSLPTDELQREIRFSKYLIEKNLNKYCYTFAYPYGGYRSDTQKMIKYAGYKMQIKVNDTAQNEDYLANTKSDGLENIKRLTVSGDLDGNGLIDRIETAINNTKNK